MFGIKTIRRIRIMSELLFDMSKQQGEQSIFLDLINSKSNKIHASTELTHRLTTRQLKAQGTVIEMQQALIEEYVPLGERVKLANLSNKCYAEHGLDIVDLVPDAPELAVEDGVVIHPELKEEYSIDPDERKAETGSNLPEEELTDHHIDSVFPTNIKEDD